MRVFVAGATGAIGRQLVPRLVAAGHYVHRMTRSESKRAMLDGLGAVPVVADALAPRRSGKEPPVALAGRSGRAPARGRGPTRAPMDRSHRPTIYRYLVTPSPGRVVTTQRSRRGLATEPADGHPTCTF